MELTESSTILSSLTPKKEQSPTLKEAETAPSSVTTPTPTMETEQPKAPPSSEDDVVTLKAKPPKRGAKKVEVTPPAKSTLTEKDSGTQSLTSDSPQPPPSPSTVRGRTLPPPRPKLETDPTSNKSAPPSPRLPRGVVPPIPPETYRWEDVKRQRAMGGYPWSHLDKPALGSKENLECSEEVDDFLRRHAWLQNSCRAKYQTFHGTSRSTPAINWESEHEYEIINPPALRVDVDPPSDERKDVEFTITTPDKRIDSETSSLGSGDPNFVRIPLHKDIDADMPDSAKEDISAQELQARMEERFFAATPETTASRTDCDVNTSQLDSSGLEDLPLRRGSRKKREDMETQARGLQQKIRSQAGRLRAKIRSMKMPERPKFNMPERPKFNMPERPKFNMPERPKFNLPERPKFNLPERPKFNLPERPKFNLPERPKFNMPERPKFKMPERPKFNMPNMPNMPTFSKREKPAKKSSSTRRPLKDRTNPSTESNASSSRKHHFFDFDFRTYPRIFDRSRKKGGEYATSSPKSMTPPPSMESDRPQMPSRRKGPVGSRWVHRFRDIKYADDEDPRHMDEDFEDEEPFRRNMDFRMNQEEMEAEDEEEMRREKVRYENEVRDAVEEMDRQRQERESIHTESTTAFRDKDYDYAVGLHLGEINPPQRNVSIPDSNKEEPSSGGSSGRHRGGVLEEIDSDEFFLRQKGISQEDVDMGRYLTTEIREAFRPPTNTLSQMDYEEEDEPTDSLGNQYRGTPEREPIPPARTMRSLKPRKRTNRTPTSAEEDAPPSPSYNTFPPARPTRRRQQVEVQQEEAEIMQEVEELQERGYDQGDIVLQKEGDDEWQDIDENEPPPMAPKRSRRGCPAPVQHEYVPEAQRNGYASHEEWKEDIVPQEVIALRMEHEYIIPGENEPAPVAPKRERRRAPSRTSGHSLQEDRTSRAAESLPRDDFPATEELVDDQKEFEMPEEVEVEEVIPMDEEQQQQESVPTRPVSQDIDGYATVEKIYPVKPARPNRVKPPRPPAPVRRKRLGNHFFSLPRKAPPVRPMRNYSTLGPSRPSRREKARKSESYVEIKDDLAPSATEDSQPSNREDLKSGDVVQRMKGRPLPAPPRPPRKTKEGQEAEGEVEKEEKTEDEPLTMTQTDASEHALGALNDAVFYSAKESIAPIAKELSLTAVVQQTETVSDQVQEAKPTEEPAKPSEEPAKPTEEPPKSTVEPAKSIEEPAKPIEEPVQVREESVQVLKEPEQAKTEPLPEAMPILKSEEISPSRVAEPSSTEEVQAFLASDNLSLGTQPFEEVTVATQTDPLPDGYCMDIEDEPPEQADACTDTADFPRSAPEAKPVIEEPMLVRLQEVQQAPPLPPRPATPPPPPPPTIIEREVPVYIMPDKDTVIELKAERLQVGDLDIERLNVGELQAQKILVSDIDGVSMQVAELTSKSGRLFVNGIELPPGFLQELYDAFPRPEPIPQTQPVSQPQSEPISTSQVPPSETDTTFRAPQSEKLAESTETKSETISSSQLQQSETISQTTIPQSESILKQPQKEVIFQPSVPPPVPPPPSSMMQQQTYADPSTISSPQPLGPSSISSLQHEFVPPSIPPPPLHIPMDPQYSYIPSAMRVKRSQLPELDSEEELISFIPSSHRRRRHHAPKPVPRYSSDEEEEAVSFQPRRHPQRNDPSIGDLSRQLGQAVSASSMRALRSLIQYTTTQLEGEDKRRELQTVLCILLILVAGLILMGFGSGKTFHYHHWDYLNPPK